MHRSSHSFPVDTAQSDRNPHLPSEGKPDHIPLGVVASLKEIWRGFRQEHAAFVVTCIYLLFEYNRPHLIYPALDIIPWGKTLLVLATFLAFSDKLTSSPPAAAILPMTGFSVCVLLSTVFAFSPSFAIHAWVMFFSWLLVVLLLTSVVNTRQRLFLFLVIYFLANTKMAQHGFRTWAMGGFGFSNWGATGSPGWFQNSGEFSMEMAVFLPLVLAYMATFRLQWSKGVRMFFYLLSIMVIGSIIASSSRGGVIGLIVAGGWFLTYSRKRFKTLIILALIAVIIYSIMPSEFKERFQTAGEDKTSLTRLLYWKYAEEAVRDNPFTGIGFKNWQVWAAANHPELKGAKGWGNIVEVIHNTYLETATELGLIGAAVYIAILMQIFFTNLRSARMARLRNDRFLEATAKALNGSLIVYMVPSYFMSVLYYPYIWILLALTVCVSTVCQHANN